MIDWNTIVMILSLLLLAFLLWREWSRSNRELLWARLIATTVAMASLYMLALPPGYSGNSGKLAKGIVLVTEGATKDSLAKADFAQMPMYEVDKDGVDELMGKYKGVNTIHVFGFGLEPYQLQKLNGQKLIFHPSDAPVGFSQVQYRNELAQGEVMELQGRFHRRDTVKTTIILVSFGTVLDSSNLDDQDVFTLSYIPAQIGLASYSLIAISGKDTLEKQVVPLNVAERYPLKVLFLGSAPGFENRFLKDWLARNGFQVVSRTRVSKKMYAKDFVNEERVQVDDIGSSLLEHTDFIVADNGALASLPDPELRLIKAAVREKGMGLLICVNGEETAREAGIEYHVSRIPGGVQQKLNLIINGGTTLKTLSTEDQYDIQREDMLLPLVQNESGRIFSTAAMVGQGRIVLNTINYSYKWKLAGAEKDYDHFWMRLVNMTLGKAAEESWQIRPRWPRVDQPITVTVETATETPVGQITGQKIYLQENPQFPGQWQGVFWPRQPGWHILKKTDETEQPFFVFDQDAWWAMRMNERANETQEFISGQNGVMSDDMRQEVTEEKHLPAILFLFLFMLAAGFLWFEQKRMDGK
jgi:hypothetical protein